MIDTAVLSAHLSRECGKEISAELIEAGIKMSRVNKDHDGLLGTDVAAQHSSAAISDVTVEPGQSLRNHILSEANSDHAVYEEIGKDAEQNDKSQLPGGSPTSSNGSGSDSNRDEAVIVYLENDTTTRRLDLVPPKPNNISSKPTLTVVQTEPSNKINNCSSNKEITQTETPPTVAPSASSCGQAACTAAASVVVSKQMDNNNNINESSSASTAAASVVVSKQMDNNNNINESSSASTTAASLIVSSPTADNNNKASSASIAADSVDLLNKRIINNNEAGSAKDGNTSTNERLWCQQ